MEKIVNVYLPTLFEFVYYPFAVVDVFTEHGLSHPIKYCYGTIRCLWSNNYDSYIKFEDKKYIETILSNHKERNIIPVINFSKVEIEPDELNDEFCNYFLDIAIQNNAEFIVASDLLYDYIKLKYPKAKLIASVNKTIDKFFRYDDLEEERAFYDELLIKYDKVVVRPEFIFNGGVLPDDKERLIIIPNSACKMGCLKTREGVSMPTLGFECCRTIQKRKYGVAKSLENLMMLTLDEVQNSGVPNILLKDNKQPLQIRTTRS